MPFEPPTSEEQRIIKEIRHDLDEKLNSCEDFGNNSSSSKFTDTTLLRFLRAQRSDKELALKSILEHIRWREENKVDSLARNTHRFQRELEKQKILQSSEYYDHNGRPVSFCPADRHHYNERDVDELVWYSVYCVENALKAARPEDERIVICYLLDKFNMNCVDYDFAEKFFEVLQKNYPETLETVFFVDAPFFFSAVWAMIKMWVDPVTAEKVKFIKSHEMTEYFPPHAIPRFEQ